jgi:uncharacterized protein YxeA
MKKLIALIASVCFSTSIFASSPIEKAFVAMPDAYYLTLTQNMRSKLLEASKNDNNATLKNRFRGESSINCIDSINDFLSVQNSPNGKADFKILREQNIPTYLVVIFTACAPLCDSHIGFYNAEWDFLPNSLLPDISIKNFLDVDKIKSDGKTTDEITQAIGMTFYQYAFVDNGNDISISLQVDKSLESDNYARIKAYLKTEKLLFKWVNGVYYLQP